MLQLIVKAKCGCCDLEESDTAVPDLVDDPSQVYNSVVFVMRSLEYRGWTFGIFDHCPECSRRINDHQSVGKAADTGD